MTNNNTPERDHDFEAVLQEFEMSEHSLSGGLYLEPYTEIIHTALRIADRLQSGEVSDGMYVAGSEANVGPRLTSHSYIYQAMAKQLIKECEE